MSDIVDNGVRNPLIAIPPDEVLAWLREKADAAGYGDREISGVQITVEHPFADGKTYHHEIPRLIVMVSNIRGGRMAA